MKQFFEKHKVMFLVVLVAVILFAVSFALETVIKGHSASLHSMVTGNQSTYTVSSKSSENATNGGKLQENTFDNLESVFKDNKDIFENAAKLMLSQEVDTNVVYDFDNQSISEVIVFDDDCFGNSVKIDDAFSSSEQEILLNCLKTMASIAPKDTCSILIRRVTSSSLYSLGIDFMFSSSLNIDYGYIFTEDPFSSYQEILEKNWYTYMYGLV